MYSVLTDPQTTKQETVPITDQKCYAASSKERETQSWDMANVL